jgi:hypothetical protein
LLKACLVGNPSAIYCPNANTWEYANMFRHAPDKFKAYIGKHGGKNLWDSDPKTAEKMAAESDALAKAYRDAGVRVVRNETGHTPEKLINYNHSWSEQRQFTLYGQSAAETFGHCFVSFWETSNSNISEIAHREAIHEMIMNDPEAVWLTMPVHFPFVDRPQLRPWLAPGDPVIGDKIVIIGIGVADPSHIKDRSKPRSSGNEDGAEILKRMLKPYGWKVCNPSAADLRGDCRQAPGAVAGGVACSLPPAPQMRITSNPSTASPDSNRPIARTASRRHAGNVTGSGPIGKESRII